MSSISASDSELQPPLEVLIIAPTFRPDTSSPADFIARCLKRCCVGEPRPRAFRTTRYNGNHARRVDAPSTSLSLRGSKIEPRRDSPHNEFVPQAMVSD